MKKLKLVGLSALLVLSATSLFACEESSVEASVPTGYELVTKDQIGQAYVSTLKNTRTNCYYTMAMKKHSGGGGVSITPMFVELNGVSVPDCE